MTETLLCKLQPLNVCMLSRVHRSSFDKWQTALLFGWKTSSHQAMGAKCFNKSVHLWCIFNDNVSWTFIKQNIFIVYFFFVFSVNSPNAIHSSDNHTTGDEPLPPRCTLNLSEFQIPTYFGEWGGKGNLRGVFSHPSHRSTAQALKNRYLLCSLSYVIMYPKK